MSTPLKLTVVGITLLISFSANAADEWGQCQVWPQPVFNYPDENRGDASATILGADSSEGRDNTIIDLLGDISVQRPTEQLFADKATYNKALKTLEARGHIRYETKDFTTQADYALIELEGDKGRFENSQYQVPLRHARGSSSAILIESKDLIVLKQASYTTCDPGSEDWILRASTIELDQASGMGNAWNTRLAFQGVPFIYIPFIRFPITSDRMTGLLAPSYSSTELGGTELALPIYLNLHPQLDATITPRNYTNRGLKWDNELRYLTHYGEGKIHSERLDDEVYGQMRTLYQFNHTGRLIDHWNSDILFNRVSDRDYFNDFGTSLNVSSITHLERHAQLTHNDSYGQFFIQAQDYQTIDDTTPYTIRPYRRLPQMTYTLAPQKAGPLRLEMNSELVRFQQQQRLTGARFNLTPSLSLPYQRPAGFIIPKVSLSHTRYQLDDEFNTLGVDQLTRNLPITSLDSGLYLERDTLLFDRDYLQTLEPRAFYLNAPYRDQSTYPNFDSGLYDFDSAQLFRNNRFAGIDRIGDTQQVTLALTSRLLRRHDGWELVRGTVGQIQYLEDRQVTLTGNQLDSSTHSETILDAELHPVRPLSLRGDMFWNSSYDTVTRRDLRLQYMSSEHRVINVSYRQRGNAITAPAAMTREIDSSILWPVTGQWSIIGRRYHSLQNDRTLEKLAGIEYNDCCWAFRAVRRAAFIEDSAATSAPFGALRYSWYLQLELKGLTSLGDSIDTLMQDKILGYTAIP
jgi:LPS-assembly protein